MPDPCSAEGTRILSILISINSSRAWWIARKMGRRKRDTVEFGSRYKAHRVLGLSPEARYLNVTSSFVLGCTAFRKLESFFLIRGSTLSKRDMNCALVILRNLRNSSGVSISHPRSRVAEAPIVYRLNNQGVTQQRRGRRVAFPTPLRILRALLAQLYGSRLGASLFFERIAPF